MSANFYELLKYAATGIASPDMTYFDRMRASTLMGGVAQTLTGIPPLSFKADGKPLISWSMKGNGSQTGTPTPDAPIMPTFCGVRTGNLMPAGEKKTVESRGITFESDGNGRYHVYGTSTGSATVQFNLAYGFTTPISISNGGQGALSLFNDDYNTNVVLTFYNGTAKVDDWRVTPKNRTSTAYNALGNKYIDAVRITVASGETVDMIIAPEFTNDGVLPTEFEPYGYKIPISCGGQTTPVYLGEVPTVRRVKKLVLDGTENIEPRTSAQTGNVVMRIDVSGYMRSTDYTPLSSHYIGLSAISGIEAFVTSGTFAFLVSGSGSNFVYIFDNRYTTAADFKEWLASEYAAGHPVTIWYVLATEQTGIVNEPLRKIGDYADELHSTDAGVAIPTVKGSNTLTVGGDLQPSEMSITYLG